MKKFKTCFGALLMGLILSGSLFSCVNSAAGDEKPAKKESKPAVEPLGISVFTVQKGINPSDGNPAYEWIKEKFGVSFTLLMPDNKDAEMNNIIASGELPDLIEVDNLTWQNAGVLRDLKPLIEENCPNLKEHYASAWSKMICADSEFDASGNIVKEHIYSLPSSGVLDGTPSYKTYKGYAFWIQKAVLKEFGYPEIKTLDQFFDLIEVYYKKYPVIDGMPTIPFAIQINQDEHSSDFWNASQLLTGHTYEGSGYVDERTAQPTYETVFSDEHTKRLIKLVNGYFQRGLIDPASFTDNNNQYRAKMTAGRVLGTFLPGSELINEIEPSLITAGKIERTYVPLPIVFDESYTPNYREYQNPSLHNGFGITVRCPKDKAIKILKFMDEMLEEENQKTLYWGFEGTDYQKGGSRTAEQRSQQKDPSWLAQNRAVFWMKAAPKIEGLTASGYINSMDDLQGEFSDSLPQEDIDLFNAYGKNSYAAVMGNEPSEDTGKYSLRYFEVENESYLAPIHTVQAKYFPQMIMGKPADFDKTWNEYSSLVAPHSSELSKNMQTKLNTLVSLSNQ